jgi:Lon protease-like protein
VRHQAFVVDRSLHAIGVQALPAEQADGRNRAVEELEQMKRMLPIFVCNVALPGSPCGLHVFEERYRLMMRRCIQHGTRLFGMCAHTQATTADGQTVRTFAQVGTAIRIRELRMLPDGRSLVDGVGTRRFRVLEAGERDGYIEARTEWLDDEPMEPWDEVPPGEDADADADAEDAEDASGSVRRLSLRAACEEVQAYVDELVRARFPEKSGAEAYGPGVRAQRFLEGVVLPVRSGPRALAAPSAFTWVAARCLPVDDSLQLGLLRVTSVRSRMQLLAAIVRSLPPPAQLQAHHTMPPSAPDGSSCPTQ